MAILDNLSRYRPQALGALRIMTALLFISHGTQKLFGFPASQMDGSLPTMLLVAALLEAAGFSTVVRRDLAGHERCVIAYPPSI